MTWGQILKKNEIFVKKDKKFAKIYSGVQNSPLISLQIWVILNRKYTNVERNLNQ